MMQENSPTLWKNMFPRPGENAHKYDRGVAAIYGSPDMPGATSLAAQACARMGCGLVNVLAPLNTGDLYKTMLPYHIIVRSQIEWWDDRINARLYGSGGLPCSVDFSKLIPTVLDADALQPRILPHITNKYILTPHEGEFLRLFQDIDIRNIQDAAVNAAKSCGAIIVLKGKHTKIAHPDGRIVINSNASPYLASAGTGDVLAGMITGLCAQGMDSFYAACAAVWIHGETGRNIGAGLVASDIPDKISKIMRDFA